MNDYLSLGIKILEAMDTDDLKTLDNIFQSGKRDVLEITDVESWNWLHKALSGFDEDRPSEKVINYLIDKGIDVNAQDMYKMTPLHYALRSKNVDGAMALLKAGADPNIPDEDNAIALAYINGMPKELELLALMLEKGGDVHFHNGDDEVLEGIKKYKSHDPDFLPVIELMEKYA